MSNTPEKVDFTAKTMNCNKRHNRNSLFSWIVIGAMALVCSCDNNHLRDDICQMVSNKVVFCKDSLLYLGSSPIADSETYKLLAFYDSTECSSCAIRNLDRWTDFINKTDTCPVDIKLYFILSPRKFERNKIKYISEHSLFRNHILIDTASYFSRNNPHIPDGAIFHTMLLNERDSIVLVGNPVNNSKIESLLFKILSQTNDISQEL